ncbi:MAG: putative DNA binding domain-containing protein [Firmicutes bacterium]|nr:putative DNA binding domain-containing protein [Bacillota bacterium]
MDWSELQKRIDKGEDLHTEFKAGPIRPDELAAALVAFANTDGGQLIFGVTNDRRIAGVEDIDRLMQEVDNIAYQNCEPPLSVVQETVQTPEGTVVVVHVPKGDLRPYRTRRGDCFIRTTSGRRRASRQELLRLFQAVESLFYEETLILKAGVNEIDLRAFARFRKDAVGEVQVDEEQLLMNWGLVKKYEERQSPTIAGLLLFGWQPQNFLPYAYISAARIPGEDAAAAPSDAKRIEGTLFDMLEDAARFLRLHLRTPHHIRGFKAEPRPELPEEALREVVVNALVHRDYTVQAPIRIFIFDGRVEIRSPGSLPNTVTVEMIKAGLAHVLRNPLIYSFFRRAGLVTDTGNGIRRTILLVKKATGLEPNIYEEGNETVVSLPRRVME